jgi:hypothetical protein
MSVNDQNRKSYPSTPRTSPAMPASNTTVAVIAIAAVVVVGGYFFYSSEPGRPANAPPAASQTSPAPSPATSAPLTPKQ